MIGELIIPHNKFMNGETALFYSYLDLNVFGLLECSWISLVVHAASEGETIRRMKECTRISLTGRLPDEAKRLLIIF